MRENGRWHLTDLQRFLVVLTVVFALFLAAMALGSTSVVLLLVAASLLVLTGLAVFVLGLRQGERAPLQGTGYVISVQRPPAAGIQGRCDMRMRINLPGRPSVDQKVRAPAVPITRWPVVGQTLPVEAPPGNPKNVRVRWDLVELGYVRAPDATPPRQSTGSPLDEISVEELEHSPTPAYTPATAPTYTPPPPPVHVYTDYADPTPHRESTVEASVVREEPGPRAARTTRLITPEPDLSFDFDDYADPAGYGEPSVLTEAPAEPSTVRVAEPPWMASPRTDPTPLDSGEPDRVVDRERDADRALGISAPVPEGTVRNIPSPRGAEEPTIRFFNSGRSDNDMPAMGGMLIVSDLDRSLRFYSDLLGFTTVYSAAGNAVVEYGGARILLQHMADFSPIERRTGHLHIEVPDLDMSFADLVAKGVVFSHRPRMVSRGEKMELWKATFRDPDGHGIALTEWRARETD